MLKKESISTDHSANIESSRVREKVVPVAIYQKPKELKVVKPEIECSKTGEKKVLDKEVLISTDIRDGYVSVVPLFKEETGSESVIGDAQPGRKDISKALLPSLSLGDLTDWHLKRTSRPKRP